MRKYALPFFALCILAGLCLGYCTVGWAVDVDLKWDPVSGATGYRVYQSINGGTAWTAVAEATTATTYTVLGVPENLLVLFRVSAYNPSGEAIRFWSGAWYDHRLKPINTPGGNSVP